MSSRLLRISKTFTAVPTIVLSKYYYNMMYIYITYSAVCSLTKVKKRKKVILYPSVRVIRCVGPRFKFEVKSSAISGLMGRTPGFLSYQGNEFDWTPSQRGANKWNLIGWPPYIYSRIAHYF